MSPLLAVASDVICSGLLQAIRLLVFALEDNLLMRCSSPAPMKTHTYMNQWQVLCLHAHKKPGYSEKPGELGELHHAFWCTGIIWLLRNLCLHATGLEVRLAYLTCICGNDAAAERRSSLWKLSWLSFTHTVNYVIWSTSTSNNPCPTELSLYMAKISSFSQQKSSWVWLRKPGFSFTWSLRNQVTAKSRQSPSFSSACKHTHRYVRSGFLLGQ